MHNQIKPLLPGRRNPSPSTRAVVLDFNDILLEDKADLQKLLHYAEGQRDKMAAAAGIADEDGAETAGFEDAVQFGGGLPHRPAELVHAGNVGQVPGNPAARIANQIQIGRMRENQVNGRLGQKRQIPDVRADDLSACIGTFPAETGQPVRTGPRPAD